MKDVPAIEIVMHRVVWSSISLLLILCVIGRIKEFFALFRNVQALKLSLLTSLLIGSNWGLFIYGIHIGKTVDVSLGYYICPLVTVFLAAFVLKEKLSKGQKVSVALATLGVGVAVLHSGVFPFIATALALSFAVYGLVRRQMKIDALMGLALETLILFIPAVIIIALWDAQGGGSFHQGDARTDWLLMSGGVITMVPLLFYSIGVRSANFVVIGFLQYIGPSLQLLTAIFIFGEAFDVISLISFALVWIALGVFVWDSLARSRRKNHLEVVTQS